MEEFQIKISNRCSHIQKECHKILVLDDKNHLMRFSKIITVSGDVEKLEQRHKLESLTFEITVNAIVNDLFLTFAKLYEPYNRNKPNSVPNLLEILNKNKHLFKNSELETIESSIGTYQILNLEFDSNIEQLKEHRDKCLGHNDSKTYGCKHLNNISRLDLERMIKNIIILIDNLSVVFGYEKFNFAQLDKIKKQLSEDTFQTIKKMES